MSTMSPSERLPSDAYEARKRGDYRDALSKLEAALGHADDHGDAEGARALAHEAARIAGQTKRGTRRHALRLAAQAERVAGVVSTDVASTEMGEQEISPLSLALTLLGAGLVLISVFLPRVDSNTFARVAKNTLIQSGDGWWFVGLAVAIAASTWFAYQHRNAGAGPLVLALIVVGLAIYYGTNKDSLTLCPVDQGASALGIGCTRASPGVGIYAAGVGGALAALGGFQMWRAPRQAEDEPEPDEDDEPGVGEDGDELEARLARLERLRQRGLLDEVEYAARRQALLDQL
jgi:hypothetical protein